MRQGRFFGTATLAMIVGLSAISCTSQSGTPDEHATVEVAPPARPPVGYAEGTGTSNESATPATMPSQTPPASSAGPRLLVANFDSGQKPSLIGGDFGSWNKDPNDLTQSCAISFDKTNDLYGAGYALKIDYDVDSPNPAYNGFWMKMEGTSLASFKALSFYAKGDRERGYTPQVKLELKNAKGDVGRALLKGITDEWRQVRIPLDEFAGLTDTSQMTEFVIVFDDLTSVKKVGTIYIDDMAFE